MSSNYGAAVCANGDIVSFHVEAGSPVDKFCDDCGAPVYTHCTKCHQRIRGASRFHTGGGASAPKYCPNCGAAYPWTLRARDARKKELDVLVKDNQITQQASEELKALADDLTDGRATDEQIRGAAQLVKKFGPALKVVWDGLSDLATSFAAKVMVEAIKGH